MKILPFRKVVPLIQKGLISSTNENLESKYNIMNNSLHALLNKEVNKQKQ